MKRFFNILARIVIGLLIGLIGLVVLVLVLIELQPVKQKMARIAEKQVGNFINGELHIGKLEGNFWNHLRIEEIALTARRRHTGQHQSN